MTKSTSIVDRARLSGCAAVAVLGVAGLFSALAWGQDFTSKGRHDTCNAAWRESPAASQQGCNLHRVNFDRFAPGIPPDAHNTSREWNYYLCYIDVYCHSGSPHGGRKGLVYLYDLDDLRRCADDPSKLDTKCAPL